MFCTIVYVHTILISFPACSLIISETKTLLLNKFQSINAVTLFFPNKLTEIK